MPLGQWPAPLPLVELGDAEHDGSNQLPHRVIAQWLRNADQLATVLCEAPADVQAVLGVAGKPVKLPNDEGVCAAFACVLKGLNQPRPVRRLRRLPGVLKVRDDLVFVARAICADVALLGFEGGSGDLVGGGDAV